MNRNEGRRDLAPLDPAAYPVLWEAMVRGINRAAAPELTRRVALPEPGVLLFLADWRRPAAAVCTAIAAGAAAILLVQAPRGADTDTGMAPSGTDGGTG